MESLKHSYINPSSAFSRSTEFRFNLTWITIMNSTKSVSCVSFLHHLSWFHTYRNTEKLMPLHPSKYKRSDDDIHRSEIIRLTEGPKIIPKPLADLYKKAREGRLKVFGSPMMTRRQHLIDQCLNDFPPVQ